MNNLASLFLDRARRRPEARFGVVEEPTTLGQAVCAAHQAALTLGEAGLEAGSRAALIGATDTNYLIAYLGLQLAGVEAALVNPELPDDLIGRMLADLGASAVLWMDRVPVAETAPGAIHLKGSDFLSGGQSAPETDPSLVGDLPGMRRHTGDTAGYMHTSGTTGPPKFCAQSHGYFLSLGRFIADSMAISPGDTVFAPLSMFHINPLGYGLMGGLTGGADVLGAKRFSASRFWPMVREHTVTVVFLHGPPVAILNKATRTEDAAGHRLRCVFLADRPFLDTFQVPMSFSGYGSTEAGGLTHIWPWRRGDPCDLPEGMSRYGGRVRPGVEWDLSQDGEILIRSTRDHILSTGYQTAEGLLPLTSEDGWFHTGDLGRRDEAQRMVFIERRSESIRVKGEFVPIHYVESHFAEIEPLDEVALWRRTGELADHEVVLYVVSRVPLPRREIRLRADALPRFMRPSAVVRIESMPRTQGAHKISRRDLPARNVLESFEMQGG